MIAPYIYLETFRFSRWYIIYIGIIGIQNLTRGFEARSKVIFWRSHDQNFHWLNFLFFVAEYLQCIYRFKSSSTAIPSTTRKWMVCLCLAVSNYTASCRTGFLKRFKFLKQISHIVQQGDIENLSRPLDF